MSPVRQALVKRKKIKVRLYRELFISGSALRGLWASERSPVSS